MIMLTGIEAKDLPRGEGFAAAESLTLSTQNGTHLGVLVQTPGAKSDDTDKVLF